MSSEVADGRDEVTTIQALRCVNAAQRRPPTTPSAGTRGDYCQGSTEASPCRAIIRRRLASRACRRSS